MHPLKTNYAPYYTCSPHHRGGGLAVFVHKSINHRLEPNKSSHLDIISIDVGTILHFVYIPPVNNSTLKPPRPSLNDLWHSLDNHIAAHHPAQTQAIIGDLNAHMDSISWKDLIKNQILHPSHRTNESGQHLKELLEQHNLEIINGTSPENAIATRMEVVKHKQETVTRKSIVDYVITNKSAARDIKMSINVPPIDTDHQIIEVHLHITQKISQIRLRKTKIRSPRWTPEIQKVYQQETLQLDLNEATTASEAVRIISDSIKSAYETAKRRIQTVKMAIPEVEHSEFHTRAVKHRHVRLLDNQIRRLKRILLQNHFTDKGIALKNLQRARNKIKQKLRRQALQLDHDMLKILSNKRPKELWNILRSREKIQDSPLTEEERLQYVKLLASNALVDSSTTLPTSTLHPISEHIKQAAKVLDSPFSESEVQKVLEHMKSWKAADKQGVFTEMLKHHSSIVRPLVWVFNKIMEGDSV